MSTLPAEWIKLARSSSAIPNDVSLAMGARIVEAPSGEAHDENHKLRFEVLKELYRSLRLTDRDFARWLMTQEMEAHRGAWGVSDSIVLCAGILFELRNPEDALLVSKAKGLTFDTDCGIPVGFMVGAGVDKTLNWLRRQASPEALELAESLTKAAYGGEFEDLAEFRSNWRNNFLEMIKTK